MFKIIMGDSYHFGKNDIGTLEKQLKNQEIMNDDQLEGKWKQIKGEFKQKYGSVTDDDSTYAEGKFDEMLGRMQEKTGKTKEELKNEIDRW